MKSFGLSVCVLVVVSSNVAELSLDNVSHHELDYLHSAICESQSNHQPRGADPRWSDEARLRLVRNNDQSLGLRRVSRGWSYVILPESTRRPRGERLPGSDGAVGLCPCCRTHVRRPTVSARSAPASYGDAKRSGDGRHVTARFELLHHSNHASGGRKCDIRCHQPLVRLVARQLCVAAVLYDRIDELRLHDIRHFRPGAGLLAEDHCAVFCDHASE